VQHGVLCVIGVLAGDLLGEGKGEAENNRYKCAKLSKDALISDKENVKRLGECVPRTVYAVYTVYADYNLPLTDRELFRRNIVSNEAVLISLDAKVR